MEACWVTKARAEQVADDAIRDVASKDDGVLWIHLNHTDEPGMELLSELIRVRPADVQECYVRTPVPKLRIYPDHYFSALNGLVRGTDGRLHFQPLKIFLTEHLLFTVLGPHHETLTNDSLRRDLDTVRKRLDDGFRPESAFILGAAIRTEILHSQEELVAVAASGVAQLELNIMRLNAIETEGLLDDLFGIRHDLQTIRTNAAQTHELFSHLTEMLNTQTDLMRLDPRQLGELRRSFDLLRKTADLEREYLQEVLDLFQTRISTELNRFVRRITAFGTIGIAWTVIAGIYGMNFTHMPELNWEFGYPGAIGLMVLVGVVLAALFRRHGWL